MGWPAPAAAKTAEMIPSWPAEALAPLRVANSYGLFAVMTAARYEIEFQGTTDGRTWIVYPFRYKPQNVDEAPGIYAPYQPRFDWNLWFASLGGWRQYSWVLSVEKDLLEQDQDVLSLFKSDPFSSGRPPIAVRAVLWRYWFSTPAEKAKTGAWWDRKLLGLYAPILARGQDGKIYAVAPPGVAGAR
ncbi:MAG: lipase maturation factor family protein [Elusimicrobia bacterium]|nr:lipase maturation factor family protein [Elusimicrobiota bacterium]